MEIEIYIAQMRSEKGVSLRTLEMRTSLKHSHINDIENGKSSPTLEEIVEIGKALKVDPYTLFKL